MTLRGVTPTLVVAIVAAALGMFQFGFNTGAINAPQRHIERFINESYARRNNGEHTLSDDAIRGLFSLAVGACLVGGMIGGLSAGAIADKVGRRRGLLYTQGISLLAALFMGLCKEADSFEMLVIGRFAIGQACGLFTGLVPLYVSEISPVHLRGAVGTVNQLAVTVGLLSSMVLGLDVALGSDDLWPLMLALGAAVPALIQTCLLPFVPSSPRFLLLKQHRDSDGRRALVRLRGVDDVDDELDDIQRESDAEESHMNVFELLRAKHLRLALLICIAMHLSQQFSGIVAVFYYSATFFEDAGISESDAKYATVGVGAIMVTMTIVTIPLMDRVGRRTLHLVGLTGIVVFSVLNTIALNIKSEDKWVGQLLVGSTLAFVVFFALGPGSIPWMITAELFRQAPRPAAIAIATLVNWSANLIVGFTFPALQTGLLNYSFVPFAVIVTVLGAVLYVYLPETKGRSVDSIADELQGPGAWKAAYNRRRRSDAHTMQQANSSLPLTQYGSSEKL